MAITDLLTRVTDSTTGRPVISALAAPGKALAAVSVNITDATNWTTATAIHFSIYNTVVAGGLTVKDTTTQTDWKGTLAGTTISNLTLTGGTDRTYTAGAIVELTPTSRYAKDTYEWGITHANVDGTLKATAIQSALGLGSGALNGWNPLGYAPSTVTYNGNRSYDLLFSGVDLTPTLSNGYRLRTTRTAVAPNQCTSLNGTTQYFVKTSPNKLTFTDDFVVSAWVKLSSYNGTSQVFASRYNGTSGWLAYVTSSGTVSLQGNNAGAGNSSVITSFSSIPLNKWVHIAAQLDMSTFTATTTTSYIMLDGLDVPATVSRAGTNPTALVQAGNLEIGGTNTGTLPFTGKIAQVAVFNAKVTQATMRTYMSQGLAGTETSLASAYSCSNSLLDLNTTTPNDLSVGGGSAVMTNADSPFGTQADGTISTTLDYAIVTKMVFSTNTTVTVQVPEGCTIPTVGGVTTVAYANTKAPYLMPVQEDKYILETRINSSITSQNLSTNVWSIFLSALTLGVYLPTGPWIYGFKGGVQWSAGGVATTSGHIALAVAAPANSTYSEKVSGWDYDSSTQFLAGPQFAQGEVTLSAATQYNIYATYDQGTATVTCLLRGDLGSFTIFARLASL